MYQVLKYDDEMFILCLSYLITTVSLDMYRIALRVRHLNYAQNFLLLKIHLNLFEMLKRGLKLENLIFNLNFFYINSENLFKTWTLQSGSMCMYSSLSRDKVKYTHMAPLRGFYV